MEKFSRCPLRMSRVLASQIHGVQRRCHCVPQISAEDEVCELRSVQGWSSYGQPPATQRDPSCVCRERSAASAPRRANRACTMSFVAKVRSRGVATVRAQRAAASSPCRTEEHKLGRWQRRRSRPICGDASTGAIIYGLSVALLKRVRRPAHALPPKYRIQNTR